MTEKDIDKAIEKIMEELRKSPDYLGHSCSAHTDSHCSQSSCETDNPKRLKKGIHCGIKPHCEQNQVKIDKN